MEMLFEANTEITFNQLTNVVDKIEKVAPKSIVDFLPELKKKTTGKNKDVDVTLEEFIKASISGKNLTYENKNEIYSCIRNGLALETKSDNFAAVMKAYVEKTAKHTFKVSEALKAKFTGLALRKLGVKNTNVSVIDNKEASDAFNKIKEKVKNVKLAPEDVKTIGIAKVIDGTFTNATKRVSEIFDAFVSEIDARATECITTKNVKAKFKRKTFESKVKSYGKKVTKNIENRKSAVMKTAENTLAVEFKSKDVASDIMRIEEAQAAAEEGDVKKSGEILGAGLTALALGVIGIVLLFVVKAISGIPLKKLINPANIKTNMKAIAGSGKNLVLRVLAVLLFIAAYVILAVAAIYAAMSIYKLAAKLVSKIKAKFAKKEAA